MVGRRWWVPPGPECHGEREIPAAKRSQHRTSQGGVWRARMQTTCWTQCEVVVGGVQPAGKCGTHIRPRLCDRLPV